MLGTLNNVHSQFWSKERQYLVSYCYSYLLRLGSLIENEVTAIDHKLGSNHRNLSSFYSVSAIITSHEICVLHHLLYNAIYIYI
jgi:hypothetical protein